MIIDLEAELDKFQTYQNRYNLHKQQSAKTKFCISKTIDSGASYKLQYFKATGDEQRTFLIVPSIINGTSIFTIGDENSFIAFLTKYGDVYLIKWNEPTSLNFNYNLNNYAEDTIDIVAKLGIKLNKKIDLIGYCLGGNFAIASAVVSTQYINSLFLLATPWDFSYFQPFRNTQKLLKLEQAIENLASIPIIYMQILFMLMDMGTTFNKFFRYSNPKNGEQPEIFFEVEKWLYTGNDITKEAYNQLMIEFVEQNVTMKGQWVLRDRCINPEEITVPVFSVLGLKDKVVASASVRAIYSKLSNYKFLEMDTGHIGLFVGQQKVKLFQEIDYWIRGINE